jgi:thioredoxin reductase (NADPH)
MPADLPVVIATGKVLRRSTPGQLSEYLGLTAGSLPERFFDVVIVGAGPAGLAAAVYAGAVGEGSTAIRSVHDYLAFNE